MVIPLKYDGASNFFNGLARVHQNHQYGYIDRTGKEIIPLKYDSIGTFENGFVYARKDDLQYKIDDKGNIVEVKKIENRKTTISPTN